MKLPERAGPKACNLTTANDIGLACGCLVLLRWWCRSIIVHQVLVVLLVWRICSGSMRCKGVHVIDLVCLYIGARIQSWPSVERSLRPNRMCMSEVIVADCPSELMQHAYAFLIVCGQIYAYRVRMAVIKLWYRTSKCVDMPRGIMTDEG